jgi:hypothetical protein
MSCSILEFFFHKHFEGAVHEYKNRLWKTEPEIKKNTCVMYCCVVCIWDPFAVVDLALSYSQLQSVSQLAVLTTSTSNTH